MPGSKPYQLTDEERERVKGDLLELISQCRRFGSADDAPDRAHAAADAARALVELSRS